MGVLADVILLPNQVFSALLYSCFPTPTEHDGADVVFPIFFY